MRFRLLFRRILFLLGFLALRRRFLAFSASGAFSDNFGKAYFPQNSGDSYLNLVTLFCARHEQHETVLLCHAVAFFSDSFYGHFQFIPDLNWGKTSRLESSIVASSPIVSHVHSIYLTIFHVNPRSNQKKAQ